MPIDAKIIRIIVEEVIRALRADGALISSAPAAACTAAPPAPATSAAPAAPRAMRGATLSIGRGLVVCTGDQKLDPEIIERLEIMQSHGIAFSALISDRFEACVTSACFANKTGITDCRRDVGIDDFKAFCQEFDFILLPCLATEVAVKAVWGMTDSLPVRVLFECLRRRFPVVLSCRFDCPDGEIPWIGDMDLGWPLWVRENMHQIWRTLQEWGLREVCLAKLIDELRELVTAPPTAMVYREGAPALTPSKTKIFLTARDIETMIHAGEKKIQLPGNAVLTGEAADLVRAHKMLILYK